MTRKPCMKRSAYRRAEPQRVSHSKRLVEILLQIKLQAIKHINTSYATDLLHAIPELSRALDFLFCKFCSCISLLYQGRQLFRLL